MALSSVNIAVSSTLQNQTVYMGPPRLTRVSRTHGHSFGIHDQCPLVRLWVWHKTRPVRWCSRLEMNGQFPALPPRSQSQISCVIRPSANGPGLTQFAPVPMTHRTEAERPRTFRHLKVETYTMNRKLFFLRHGPGYRSFRKWNRLCHSHGSSETWDFLATIHDGLASSGRSRDWATHNIHEVSSACHRHSSTGHTPNKRQ